MPTNPALASQIHPQTPALPLERSARATLQRGARATPLRLPLALSLAISLPLSLAACSSSDTTASSSATSSATGTGGTGGSPSSTSTTSTTGTGGAAPATAAVLTDLSLPGDPHKIDVYLPSNAERVVVFLHGGGGSKQGAAAVETGIRLDNPPAATPVPNTAWLTARRTAFVFPQGQAIAASPKATTWSNHVMTSGVDDVAFLTALAKALRAGGLEASVPAFTHVYLAGHSNGGMMANRVWCEASATFDAYGALAGPASLQLAPSSLMIGGADPLLGAHACAPTNPRPYLAVIGEQDTILQTKGAWDQDTWSINSCLSQGGGGAMIDPNLVSEQRFHDFRVTSVCGAKTAGPKVSADGSTSTWSDCGGKVQLQGITKADHCVSAGQVVCLNNKILPGSCANSLDAEGGTPTRDTLTDFFVATE